MPAVSSQQDFVSETLQLSEANSGNRKEANHTNLVDRGTAILCKAPRWSCGNPSRPSLHARLVASLLFQQAPTFSSEDRFNVALNLVDLTPTTECTRDKQAASFRFSSLHQAHVNESATRASERDRIMRTRLSNRSKPTCCSPSRVCWP